MGAFSFLRTAAWAGFDLANTIFSINVVSLYFPLWVVQTRGGSDLLYAIASSASLFVASCLMPFLGTLSDRLQKRMLFLIPATLLCIFATALLSRTTSLMAGLFLFGLAHLGYQLGLIFYDALLPEMGPSHWLGRVSGLGIAFGYVGTLIGLAIARPVVLSRGYQAVFLPTAAAFLLFSIPCFLFVRDPQRQTKVPVQSGIAYFEKGSPLRQILKIYFFALLAIQPVILFMSVYTQKVVGFSDAEMIRFFFLTTCSAIGGAWGCGVLTDHWGPKRTLLLSLGGWGVGLLIAALTTRPWHFWLAGCFIGTVLGSTWVSNRVLVVHFSPEKHLGEVFGWAGLVGRLAAILGPLLWGSIVWGFKAYFPWNYRLAVFSLLIWVVLSATLLVKRLS